MELGLPAAGQRSATGLCAARLAARQADARLGGATFRPGVEGPAAAALAQPATAQFELALGHRARVTACAFSLDGRSILWASVDNALRLWDARSGALLRNHLHAPNASAAWLPDGSPLQHASGAAWPHLRWWGPTPEHPLGGSWPLECPPLGKTVAVQPWTEERVATPQGSPA